MRSNDELDETDWRLLDELQIDARLSFNELGRRVSLSPPAVAERVRRMEQAGVITGYRAQVDPGRVGAPLTAFVRLRCPLGHCLLQTGRAEDFPEVVEIHKLSGEHCALLKVRTASLSDFEGSSSASGATGRCARTSCCRRSTSAPPFGAPSLRRARSRRRQAGRQGRNERTPERYAR